MNGPLSQYLMDLRGKVFCKIIRPIIYTFVPEDVEFWLGRNFFEPQVSYIQRFWCFVSHCLVDNAFAVALSVLMGVGGCKWPSSVRICWTLAVCELWKMAAVSASASFDTKWQMVLHSVSIGPFGWTVLVRLRVLLRKKCPTRRFIACGSIE